MAKNEFEFFIFTVFLPCKHVKIALPVGPKPHKAGKIAGTWCYSHYDVKTTQELTQKPNKPNREIYPG